MSLPLFHPCHPSSAWLILVFSSAGLSFQLPNLVDLALLVKRCGLWKSMSLPGHRPPIRLAVAEVAKEPNMLLLYYTGFRSRVEIVASNVLDKGPNLLVLE